MAAVTRVKAHPVSPPAYEVNDKGQAAAALVAGDQLVLVTTTPGNGFEKVWDKAPTTGITEADGIALMDAKSGAIVSVGIQGEMDGFSGMTPGAKLYPSGSTAGGLDTTALTYYSAATSPAVAVPAPARVKAITATRIRYSYL